MRKVRRGLVGRWMKDKRLKVKTLDDKDKETFRERTVVLENLPLHIRPNELASQIAKYGAITSIELPVYDSFIQQQLESKVK